jgi:RNA polymerase sigma-70 factor (ECF subfamily)
MLKTPTSISVAADPGATEELALVRRCLARDGAAWRALYDRHFTRVARLVRALGVHDSEADELSQEIFLIVYRHLGSFRGEARLSTWIHRLATREAVRHAKRRRMKRALLELFGRLEPPPVPPDWADNELSRRQYLNQLLERLPPERRLALVMFEIEGRPAEEIAQLCGCAVNTVWTRIHRARADLERMARQGLEGETRA